MLEVGLWVIKESLLKQLIKEGVKAETVRRGRGS